MEIERIKPLNDIPKTPKRPDPIPTNDIDQSEVLEKIFRNTLPKIDLECIKMNKSIG